LYNKCGNKHGATVNIKVDLKESYGVDLFHLAEDIDKYQAVVNVVMNFWAQFLG
jgi:hypothetical protein